jgi:hypothetical protein
MTARQDNTAMIDHLRLGHCLHRLAWETSPLHERASAGWAPVGDGVGGEHSVAVAAEAFHVEQYYRINAAEILGRLGQIRRAASATG